MTETSSERLQAEIAALGPWFHNLRLPDGTQTAPDHVLGDFPRFKWERLRDRLPPDLEGWTALDIGCNAGFYAFELARRGARVTAIDGDPRYLAQARWASQQYGLENQVEFRQMQVYDLARTNERFDLVLFMGVFYHLRYPMLGLDIVAQRVRRLMVFQSLSMPGEEVVEETDGFGLDDREVLAQPGWPRMAFLEHRFADDPTNWWVPNRAAVEAMLRSAGLRLLARPEAETYLCESDPNHDRSAAAWTLAEYRAATGQS